MRFQHVWASVAFASAAAAQFIFPNSSSSLKVNKAIQIQWQKSGLQAPISINLVPAGSTIRQDIVLKQVAVNIGNVGVLQWTADETISAFPKFAMVITDARSQVIVSQPFPIQSLTRPPTQQIDLGDGDAGKKNGDNKKNGDKAQKNNGDKNNKDGGKDANKDASKGDKNQNSKDKDQKDKAADKNGSKDEAKGTLLPLPGLPASDASPVSLKPLPTAAVSASAPAANPAAPAEGQQATETPAPAPAVPAAPEAAPAAPAAPEAAPAAPTPPPAAPEAAAPEAPKAEPAAPEATTSTSSAAEAAKKSEAAAPAPAEAAPKGFVTVNPAAAPTPADAAKAADVAVAGPPGLQNAEAVVAGGSFREQNGDDSPTTLRPLPSSRAGEDPSTLLPLPNEKTITTAITPRPASLVSSEAAAAAGASETAAARQSAAGGSKPTALAEKNGAQRRDPSLALGLLGVAAGWALL